MFTHEVDSPIRGDALLDVYFIRPESSFTFSSIVQRISYHHEVIQEVEWEEICCVRQVENLVAVYHKTDVYAYKPSSGINLEYGQAMVVAWRYGIISRK